MFKNKEKLKKCLICISLVSLFLLCIFIILNIYEYRIYTINFNKDIAAIVCKIQEEYPDISENEIMEILNTNFSETDIFKKYGISVNNDSLILKNESEHYIFLITGIIFFVISLFSIVSIFLIYNKSRDKEISEITRYIEEINKRNYTLHIDEISEDELSILKNEVYKTTIMLKESAENSNKDKKNLKKSLEDISHQLKTPITSILVMLDNLIDNEDMDIVTREEFIRDIKRETTNINFLVQTLLKLSKFDSNTINFVKEKVKVQDIIGEVTKNVSTLCDLKNIRLEVQGEENAKIECDFRWETEAITNIVKNAIDHSEEGEKVIINYEENSVYTLILVEDFGNGIPEQDLPHIFDRFYKGKDSREDSVGIGLALAKAVIEEDNGAICVESSENGTKFAIKYFKI